MNKKFFLSIIFAVVIISLNFDFAAAQCALCKETAASSLAEGNTSAAGLNIGILYLLVMPYALIGGLGYWWYTSNKKKKLLAEKVIDSLQ